MGSDAYIIAVARSALTKANKGAFRSMRIDDVAAQVLKDLIVSVPGLTTSEIEDVLVGCAMPEGEQGCNIARNISFLAGLPVEVGAVTINRFCASSLEAISQAAANIMSDNGSLFIAGGVESMSHVPIGGFNPSFNEKLMFGDAPDAYISMGATAENLARHYAISREEQDRYALTSHRRAVAAQSKGIFSREIIPVKVPRSEGLLNVISIDEGPRADTSLEALSDLKPAFAEDGTVTAGNSSPLTDGVAFTILASKKMAKKLGAKPLAKIVASAVVGVDPSVMGLGPVYAIPKVLRRARMKLSDIDLIEINEAFSVQTLVAMRELDVDDRKLNVHGGAIALGHPLGASGARICTTLLNAMLEQNAKTGLVSMCVGGGQGMAIILERV